MESDGEGGGSKTNALTKRVINVPVIHMICYDREELFKAVLMRFLTESTQKNPTPSQLHISPNQPPLSQVPVERFTQHRETREFKLKKVDDEDFHSPFFQSFTPQWGCPLLL